MQRPDGSFEEETGIYVEPLQLQVVCRRLWDELPAQARDDRRSRACAGPATSTRRWPAYYDASVGEIAGGGVPAERGVREWFGERLITAGGIRGQVLREQAASGGLDNAAVDRLVGTHLVRSEERDGKTWFELAHDRLVAPVPKLEHRLVRGSTCNPLQRQAALWEREGRPERLLLRGQDLKQAESWARGSATAVRPVEADLLSRSVRQRRAERTKRVTWGLIVAGLVIVSLVVGFLWHNAKEAERKATRAARLAESRALAANARGLLDGNLDSAVRGALDGRARADTVEARSALMAAAQRTDGLVRFLRFGVPLRSLAAGSGGIAVGFGDGTVRLLGPRGRPVGNATKVDPKSDTSIESVALAPGRPLLAAAAADTVTIRRGARARIGPLAPGGVRKTSRHPPIDQIWSVAFSRDGTRVAAGGHGGVALWRVEAGHRGAQIPLVQPRAGGRAVDTVAFSPSLPLLAATSASGLWVWNLAARGGRPRRIAASRVESAGPLALGPHVGAVATHGRALLWRRFPGGPVQRVCARGRTTALAFDTGGTLLACGMEDGSVSLVDVRSGRLLGPPLRGQGGAIVSLAFEPASFLLAVAADDNTVALWDVESRARELRTSGGFGSRLTAAAFGRDGVVAALTASAAVDVGALDGAGALRRAPKTILARSGNSNGAKLVASPDGRKFVVVQDSGNLVAGDVDLALKPRKSLPRPPPYGLPQQDASISNDGHVVAISGGDGTVNAWYRGSSSPGLEPRAVCRPATCEPTAVAISGDGKRVAAYYKAVRKVVLWQRSGVGTSSYDVLAVPGAAGGDVTELAFSPDGTLLAAAGDPEGTIKLWQLAAPAKPQVLRAQRGRVNGVAFAPDGRILASGGQDGTVRLWDVETGEALGGPLRLVKPVTAVAFSPDGHRLLAVHGRLSVWDVTRWQDANDEHDEQGGRLERLADRFCGALWPSRPPCLPRSDWQFPSRSS